MPPVVVQDRQELHQTRASELGELTSVRPAIECDSLVRPDPKIPSLESLQALHGADIQSRDPEYVKWLLDPKQDDIGAVARRTYLEAGNHLKELLASDCAEIKQKIAIRDYTAFTGLGMGGYADMGLGQNYIEAALQERIFSPRDLNATREVVAELYKSKPPLREIFGIDLLSGEVGVKALVNAPSEFLAALKLLHEFRAQTDRESTVGMLTNLYSAELNESFIKSPLEVSTRYQALYNAGLRDHREILLAIQDQSLTHALSSDPSILSPQELAVRERFLSCRELNRQIASQLDDRFKALGASSPGASKIAEMIEAYLGPSLVAAYAKGDLPEAGYAQKTVCALLSETSLGLELARPLDDLHNHSQKRQDYLNKLTQDEILSLLCLIPTSFYPSTNNLLFTKLKSTLDDKGASTALEKCGLLSRTDATLNLVLRAGLHRWDFGDSTSIFSQSEMRLFGDSLGSRVCQLAREPEYEDFLGVAWVLADNAQALKASSFFDGLGRQLRECLPTLKKDSIQERATRYLLYEFVDENALTAAEQDSLKAIARQSIFNPDDYRGLDGKIQMVQVFAHDDAEKYHWDNSNRLFGKIGGSQSRQTELGTANTYQNDDVSVTLFLANEGDPENNTVEFVQGMLKENPNQILVFRGHIYSLDSYIPSDTFSEHKGKVLFLPGGCGSLSSVPSYLWEAGNESEIMPISYVFTGYGDVTNRIASSLIKQKEPIDINAFLDMHTPFLEKMGLPRHSVQSYGPGVELLCFARANW